MKRNFFVKSALVFIFFLQSISSALSQALTFRPLNSSRQELEQLRQPLIDWAQLNIYKEENRTLALPTTGENRVVFFGDSIIEFWSLSSYFLAKSYINRGISGQTTPQLLIRLRPDVIALKPKAVLVLAGTNDLAGNTGFMTLEMIENNYTSISELAQANGIHVIFASVLPIHDYSLIKQSSVRDPIRIRALNDWLKHHCKQHHHNYLDYYSSMLDAQGMLRAELSDDGLHPNNKGYKIMTSLTKAAIQKVLGSRKVNLTATT